MKLNIKNLLSQKIKEAKKRPNWFYSSFDKQIDFINDPAKLKVAFCTRRGGKSYGAGIYLFKEAFETPNCSVLYVAKTADSAERIMWRPILKEIDRVLGLKCHFSNQKRIVTLPNGSQIYVLGADASVDEQEKLLGQKFKLCVVDEASKFRLDVRQLIFDKLKPAVADYMGTIVMLGTPDDFINSYFAEVTRGKIPGWNVHTWSALDNPHMAHQFQAEIDQILKTNPESENEAWFRQNYRKEWVVRDDVRMYKYDEKTILQKTPVTVPLLYSMGIVFDHKSMAAISIVAYSESSRKAYVVDSYQSEITDIKHTVGKIREFQDKYNITSYACPGASKKLLEQIRMRYQLTLDNDPEKDQAALIRLFRSELIEKNIKVFPECADILYEWDSIVIDEEHKRELREHPNCKAHLATATLHAWYKCFNYNYTPKTHTDDVMDEKWEEIEEKLRYQDYLENTEQKEFFDDFE